MRSPRASVAIGDTKHRMAVWLAILAPLVLVPSPGHADSEPNRSFPPDPVSLGQPSRLRLAWGLLGGYSEGQKEEPPEGTGVSGWGARVYVNAARRVIGPSLGGLELSLEGAAGAVAGEKPGGAVGVYAGLPWLMVGNEYAGADLGGNTFAISLRFPERRGGLFGRSDLLRLDYHPARRELLGGFSFQFPFNACRPSRPRQTGIELPHRGRSVTSAPRPAVALAVSTERHLEDVRHAMQWLDRLQTPQLSSEWLEKEAPTLRDHIRLPGHTSREEDDRYHRDLEGAFATAIGDPALGHQVAALAESILFHDVLVPFDRAFGQEKSPRHAGGYCTLALDAFGGRVAVLLASSQAPTDSLAGARCREVFRRVLQEVREISIGAGERWKNPFLVWSNRGAMAWLPLQYGLRPDQYDTQEEWDAAIAEVAGEPFSDTNTIEYLMMEQFHYALKRMILATQRYQVTIVHDFRGKNAAGTADLYGWDLVAYAYLSAFRNAVLELDSGKRDRLPQFFLFLDANYYEANGSREIMTYLENLYDPPAQWLKPGEVQTQITQAHEALLAVIRSSKALQGARKSDLRRAFKVHVSITNPFDPAYMLDVTRRDHRKVAFRDVTELDPASGAALITGQGVGEHYNGSGWEDRSLQLRGCSLVQLKAAARRLLMQQGYREREIPEVLRPLAYPPDYAARCDSLRVKEHWTTSANVLINETGYGPKEASVLKAAIFGLAPAGSVLLSYDSLWISDFWAGMFLSAALRGAQVFPVGPVPLNAPSAATTTLCFLRHNLGRMFQAQQFFADDFARAGGQLRVGLYAHDVQTQDLSRRIQAFRDGRKNHAFLRELIPLDPSVDDSLKNFKKQFDDLAQVGLKLRPRPFLHMKTLFFATSEAFEIYRLREWAPTLTAYMMTRMRQIQGMADTVGIRPMVFRRPAGRSIYDAFQAHLDSLGPDVKRHVIFTLVTGSHNQNPRSLLLDGEVLAAVSGFDCVVSMVDVGFILCISEWPENQKEFDRLFPEHNPPFILKPFLNALEDQS